MPRDEEQDMRKAQHLMKGGGVDARRAQTWKGGMWDYERRTSSQTCHRCFQSGKKREVAEQRQDQERRKEEEERDR